MIIPLSHISPVVRYDLELRERVTYYALGSRIATDAMTPPPIPPTRCVEPQAYIP
jgi:hypothetical protein